jgi:hypothetical protein
MALSTASGSATFQKRRPLFSSSSVSMRPRDGVDVIAVTKSA